MSTPVAYLNGKWIPASELSVPVDDIGFLMGVTVVERLRTFQGRVFREAEHMQRLRRSLEIVGWDTKALVAQIQTAISEFMDRNAESVLPGDDWYVATFVTPGRTPDARQPTVCVHGGPLPFASWADRFQKGVRLVVADTRQVPGSCWPPDMKCRSRIHYYLADREAVAQAPDARAILLDQDGFVGEASTANIVAYIQDRGLVTPPRDKVLPGVTQQVLFEFAKELGIAHLECDITLEELRRADEVYLTSTSVCILPVVQIDEQPVSSGQPGPVYAELLSAWDKHTGVDVAAQATRFAAR